MTHGNSQNLSELSMSDLFRSEVETHTATLHDGLLALKSNPAALDNLEPLMRAVHSIKGGARIVELDEAVRISHAMEACFIAAQKGDVKLGSEQIGILLQGVEMLRRIADAAGEEATEWLTGNQEEIEHLVTAITGIMISGTPDTPPIPFKEGMEEKKPPPSPTKPVQKPKQPLAEKFSGGITDESMLDLFRTEVETHTAALTDGLLALEENPDATDKLESLMRAAHSVKGGSRVVELDAAVQIAHVMEDCFVAAQKGKITINSDHIDVLLQGVDLLSQIAEAAGEGAAEWLAERQEKIHYLLTAISAILSGETVLPPATPVPKPTPPSVQKSSLEGPVRSPSTPLRVDSAEGGKGNTVDLREGSSKIPPNPPLEKGGKERVPPFSKGGLGGILTDVHSSPELKSTVLGGKGGVPQAVKKPSAGETPALPGTEEKPAQLSSEEKDRMVRVTAAKIERLMGLGGEVVVSARWLPSFSESLLALKKTHNELFTVLEKMQDVLGEAEENPQAKSLVLQAREKNRECNLFLADRLNQLDMFSSTSANLSDRLYHEVISVRMRPFADGVQRFPRMVRDLAKKLGKKIKFEILGKSTEVDRDILEKLDAPLTHLLRNAIDHGVESPEERLATGKPETGTLRLEAVHRAGMLMITLSDDGQGIDLTKLRQKILNRGLADPAIVENLTESELMEFLFLPGFSTSSSITEISGRGVGLDVVHDMVHEVGGIVRAVSTPGKGVSFHLELPLTLSVIRTFLVEIAEEPYAFPLARIDRCVVLSEEELETVEDRQYFRFDNTNIALVDIHDVLEIEEPASHSEGLPVVVISDRSNAYGLLVDKFVGERDLVVRPIDPRLGKVPDVSAVAVMLDGSPVLIFDVDDMLRSVDKMLNFKRLRKVKGALEEGAEEILMKRILVVDDSITVREMERKLLENQGYQVEVAVDGMDGWNAIRTENFDLVVTDIDMPRMNGIELLTHIKQHDDLKSLPVIIISYKDTKAHRLQGLEAGANYYLTKSSFQDDSFISAVVDLIGEA